MTEKINNLSREFRKSIKKPKTIIYLIVTLLLIGLLLGFYFKRFDLTEDKRYTLTPTTIEILESVDKPILIDVYLDGAFPANFKQLQRETTTLLEEFKRINSNIDYRFIDPIEDKIPEDSLMKMGFQPSILPVEKDGSVTQILIIPYAFASNEYGGLPISLINQNRSLSLNEQINSSFELLEYKFISTIDILKNGQRKKIGFLNNHGELSEIERYSLLNSLGAKYDVYTYRQTDSLVPFQIKDIETVKELDAIIVAKPRYKWTDDEKVVMDQYIMNGGKTMWMVDAVNAEMDSLFRSEKILGYPYDTNLTDLLFAYGVRINPVLVKDIERATPIVVQQGNVGDAKSFGNIPNPYHPFGIADTEHSITKNLGRIRFSFPSSIDTLAVEGIQKTILYQTSPFTSITPSPSYIALKDLVNMPTDSIGIIYNKGSKILAVLLEGKFTSAYSGRIEGKTTPNFKSESPPNKMIIIADGDIGKNDIFLDQPLNLGDDKYSLNPNKKEQPPINYANAEFLNNCMDYLLDDKGLIELRNRKIQNRLLNNQQIIGEKSEWQFKNLIYPLIFIWIVGLIFIYFKKKRYGS